jgi:hypothetical protein
MRAHRDRASGIYAERVLDDPLPWTRMRAVYRLIGLVREYGPDGVEAVCSRAAVPGQPERRNDGAPKQPALRAQGHSARTPGHRRTNKLDHAAFLELLLSDELNRRESRSAGLDATCGWKHAWI